MEKIMYTLEVTMTISGKYPPKEGVYHLKWEPNLVKTIGCETFKFVTLDMATAMSRINYLVEMHPEDYFSKIEIKND